jgi:hypothetical protein
LALGKFLKRRRKRDEKKYSETKIKQIKVNKEGASYSERLEFDCDPGVLVAFLILPR